jgi:hypothetical protein
MSTTIENTYIGDGSTVLYSFTFPYIAESDVKVSINQLITSAFSFANPTTIEFDTAPTAGTTIRIYRQTTTDSISSTFFSGSTIRAQDLNDNFEQTLYVVQENQTIIENSDAASVIGIATEALATANQAEATANAISSTANTALTTSNAANVSANQAAADAVTANSTATAANSVANAALTTANEAKTTAETLGTPTGIISIFGGNTPPAGYLECNGQSTAGYSALAAIVGANVPDLRGEFVRGFDNGRGVDAGRTLLSTQADELKAHTHTYYRSYVAGNAQGAGTFNGDQQTSTGSTGGSETRPRNVALMYIIKT